MTIVYTKTVETLADIEKEVEKEYAFLTWLEYMEEKEARAKAKKTVYEKYSSVVEQLKKDGKLK